MTRMSLFSSPLLLGFDQFERTLDRVSKMSAEGYPPYNIEQVTDHALRITLAVAGFREEDLSVRIENKQLVIRGRQQDDDTRVYIHRGIAARQFQRSFVLAEGIEVTGAQLDNGLLHIDLERPVEDEESRTIEIRTSGKRKTAASGPTLDTGPVVKSGTSPARPAADAGILETASTRLPDRTA